MQEQVKIQIRYWEDTQYGRFCDALYFTQDEYVKTEQKDIDAEKQRRLDNWIAIVSKPPVEPTKEQLEADLVALQNELTMKQADIAEMQTKIAVKAVVEKVIVEE